MGLPETPDHKPAQSPRGHVAAQSHPFPHLPCLMPGDGMVVYICSHEVLCPSTSPGSEGTPARAPAMCHHCSVEAHVLA